MLRRGINFWGRDFRHLYLLGNPLVYWMSTTSIVIYVAFRAILLLLDKRGTHIHLAGKIHDMRQVKEREAYICHSYDRSKEVL